jgi:hypothetical protein
MRNENRWQTKLAKTRERRVLQICSSAVAFKHGHRQEFSAGSLITAPPCKSIAPLVPELIIHCGNVTINEKGNHLIGLPLLANARASHGPIDGGGGSKC